MKRGLEKRLKDLERQQAGPAKYVLRWCDNDEAPDPDQTVIKLKWLDEYEKEHRETA